MIIDAPHIHPQPALPPVREAAARQIGVAPDGNVVEDVSAGGDEEGGEEAGGDGVRGREDYVGAGVGCAPEEGGRGAGGVEGGGGKEGVGERDRVGEREEGAPG